MYWIANIQLKFVQQLFTFIQLNPLELIDFYIAIILAPFANMV